MILAISSEELTDVERRQLERKQSAREVWEEGRPDDALLILETVLGEQMTPRVAAECYVTQAAFLAELNRFPESLTALEHASEFLDSAPDRVKGSFHHQRARVRKVEGKLDAAITDYTGAAVYWQASGSHDLEGIVYLNMAHVYLDLRDHVHARTSLDRAFEIFREHCSFYLSQAFDTLANIELAAGRLEAALSAVDHALDLVGDNDVWRATFSETKNNIEANLLELLGVSKVEDLDGLKVSLVRHALIRASGNLSHAGKLIGLSYKGVDYIVQRNAELERFRTKRKPRLKSVIKKSC